MIERICPICETKFNVENEDDSLFDKFECFCIFHELTQQEIEELKQEGFGNDKNDETMDKKSAI